jgi:hypothetical protein
MRKYISSRIEPTSEVPFENLNGNSLSRQVLMSENVPTMTTLPTLPTLLLNITNEIETSEKPLFRRIYGPTTKADYELLTKEEVVMN